MIITITNLIQESLAMHDLNYELSGDGEGKGFIIFTSDASLCINILESDVYVGGMYKHNVPRNQAPKLRILCKELSSHDSYRYSIESGRIMCIISLSHKEIINNPDIVYQELIKISNKLTDFYVDNTEVPMPGCQSGIQRTNCMSAVSLKKRLEEVSATVSKALQELENVKDELENYKDLIEEKAQAARGRADSYSSWNTRAENRASELENKFSDIEELYNEIDGAYDELHHAEMTLSIAVMGTYVLE